MKKILNNAACAATVILAGVLSASAQTYFTNNSPQSGAYQYNQNYTQPLQPSKTLAQQYQAGILAGTITPQPWFFLTNSFSTNIYSTAPIITANASQLAAPGINTNVVAVVSVTPTNFVLQTAVSNQVIYWEAVGH